MTVILLKAHIAHHTLPPFEWSGLSVVGRQETVDRLPHLSGRGKAGTAQSSPGQDAEPDFHLIEPAGMRRRVVPMHVGMAVSPTITLGLMTAQMVQHHVNLLPGIVRHYLVHEVQELPVPPARVRTRLHLPGGHVQSRKQGDGAMTLVLVVKA